MYGEPARPVPQAELQAAWLDGNTYQADILAAFDANADGKLDVTELVLDSTEKQALVAAHLEAGGLELPRIMGEGRNLIASTMMWLAVRGQSVIARPATPVIRRVSPSRLSWRRIHQRV